MLIFSHSWAASLSRPHSQSWNNFEGSAATTLVFSHFMALPLLTAELGVYWRASGTFTSHLQGIKKWLSRLTNCIILQLMRQNTAAWPSWHPWAPVGTRWHPLAPVGTRWHPWKAGIAFSRGAAVRCSVKSYVFSNFSDLSTIETTGPRWSL